MDSYKPQPLEERKSQNLNFWDYAKDRLFWAALPLATGGAAVAFGRVTENKVWPLNGSPDLLTTLHAKIAEKLGRNAEFTKWVKEGAWMGDAINTLGGPDKEVYRKDYFNFTKGAEVALPFSAYFLWHKKEENRLDLQDASSRLKGVAYVKPSDAELREQNDVMRKEIAFAARGNTPKPVVDAASVSHQGRVAEQQRQRSS